MASMSSGSSRSTRSYIVSRQVQKSSSGWPRTSASPAIARWNACEWTLGMPGSKGPAARGALSGGVAVATRVIMPVSSHSRRTSRAQPEGRSAWSAWRDGIAAMIPAMARLLLDDARIATMRGGRYGLVERGALLANDGRIEWIGDRSQRPEAKVDERIDAHGALVTPALIDCHTHLVYAGHRADQFAMRLAGRTYEEISRAGGGIASTVRATRAASAAELEASARRRLDALR